MKFYTSARRKLIFASEGKPESALSNCFGRAMPRGMRGLLKFATEGASIPVREFCLLPSTLHPGKVSFEDSSQFWFI